MRKILVIWEQVPDSMQLYLIEPVDEAERKAILLAHGHHINHDDGAEALSEILEGREPLYDNEAGGDYPSINEPVDIVCSGFIL